ncbi:monocarboxylate transporter 13 [Strongylocentrotus purpuratus]|uniref:Major facilitator superfamily (MFS) profile domain-containing protein n=1 Tax=Strongylocentrotus purpuratus TaxID=7668 RepID=A0A7M7G0D8_STRPU|nr:monocarboxylate transporter 13 [Strongylocentrotus purpuratus]
MPDGESKFIKQEPYCDDVEDGESLKHRMSAPCQSDSAHSIQLLDEGIAHKMKESQHKTQYVGHKPRWWKYVVLFGTFIDFLLVFGFFKGIGVFLVEWQQYYDITAVEASTITIGTAFVLPFTTPIGGALCQRYGCRPVAVTGALIASSATLVAAFSPNVPVLIFMLCICGVGLSMTFAPCPAILGFYFGRHLGFASGIMMSGVGAGILIIPPMMQALCNTYGWQGAFLIFSAIFANAVLCGMVYRPTPAERFNIDKLRAAHSQAQSSGFHLEKSSFSDQDKNMQDVSDHCNVKTNGVNPKGQGPTVTNKFVQLIRFFHFQLLWSDRLVTLFFTSILFVSFGYYSSLVYLTPRAVNDLGIAKQDASYILSTMGISSMVSRVTHGPLLDRKIISVFHLAPISLTISGLSSLLNPLANSYILQHLLAISFGIGSGAFNGMAPMLIRTLVDSSVVSSAFGLYVMTTAFGNLIGTFTLGALYDATGTYHSSFYIAGASTSMGVFLFVIQALLKRNESSKSGKDRRYQEVTCEGVDELGKTTSAV